MDDSQSLQPEEAKKLILEVKQDIDQIMADFNRQMDELMKKVDSIHIEAIKKNI